MASNPAPTIHFGLGRIVLLKPPLRRIEAIVSVRNTAPSALTLLVPAVLNPSAAPSGPSIFGVDAYQSPQSALTFRRLHGRSSFWMFELEAGAAFALRHLPIQFWPDEQASACELELIYGARVVAGGETLSGALVSRSFEGDIAEA